jgi:Zn-finger nucleic acid-binding protein
MLAFPRVSVREANVTCPDCRLPLAACTLDDRPALSCKRCDGVWIEESVLRSIYQARNKRAMPDPSEFDIGEPDRPCPVCAKAMTHQTYGLTSIDVCEVHGIWLDSGELTQILTPHKSIEQMGFKVFPLKEWKK